MALFRGRRSNEDGGGLTGQIRSRAPNVAPSCTCSSTGLGCRRPWPVSTATPMKPGADPTGGGDWRDPLDAGPRRRRPASGPLLTTALFLPYSSNLAERVVYAKEWL